ncbi:TlpA disulfide reductase family protein [Rhodoferax sp. BAB1]|uniref:TlpA family protein disulfide reductase n=1 Tax=Rhodoferax sp. BAB1 TaxID=2741720 RepID=UPI00157615BB|nr:TlpA disulfide reductase family protein [Rhodoferax sp. BAB1]QKO20597.1 TlpA family protein disulfide reductase [Rhodoferax sp. BAB1]
MNPQRRQLVAGSALLAGTLALGRSAGAQSAPAAPSSPGVEAKAGPLPAVGTSLALPEVPLLDGTVFRPAQAEGRVLVIYWWASTCPFCALQSPEMQKLWDSQRVLGNRGVLLLTLSIDRKREDATAYLQKKGYTFPAGYVTPEIQRVLPKPRGLPITLVRGRDGRVLQAERGQLFPEDVELLARWAG